MVETSSGRGTRRKITIIPPSGKISDMISAGSELSLPGKSLRGVSGSRKLLRVVRDLLFRTGLSEFLVPPRDTDMSCPELSLLTRTLDDTREVLDD